MTLFFSHFVFSFFAETKLRSNKKRRAFVQQDAFCMKEMETLHWALGHLPSVDVARDPVALDEVFFLLSQIFCVDVFEVQNASLILLQIQSYVRVAFKQSQATAKSYFVFLAVFLVAGGWRLQAVRIFSTYWAHTSVSPVDFCDTL